MPAQPSVSPVSVAAAQPAPATTAVQPTLKVVPDNAYVHTIEGGESLYAIARRYNVTTDAIVQANGLASPDKIFVGQKVIIPGRPDLLAQRAAPTATPTPVAAPETTGSVATASAPATPTVTADPVAAPAATPVASTTPIADPALSGAEKFRWPVSGRVIVDFATSKGTGINIEAPEGAAVRAVENGTIIYVGSAVEGYGNLVLVRHANGFVSAYAHLKDITVAKDDAISRGDGIGTTGMTGSVTRPQLHFELRKGATPVDPMQYLAG